MNNKLNMCKFMTETTDNYNFLTAMSSIQLSFACLMCICYLLARIFVYSAYLLHNKNYYC